MKTADMHCDTIMQLMDEKRGETLRENSLHIDTRKLMHADYVLQCFAMFVDLHEQEHPFLYCNSMIDKFYEQMKACEDVIAPVTSAAQMKENMRKGKISALLTVEEGGVCEGDMEKLHALYERGVRMMTLSWNYQNELCCSNRVDEYGNRMEEQAANTVSGLTKKGFAFVEEMNHLGMLIDVSHLSDAGFYDVLHTTKKPFVASHSNARKICANSRNLTDDMIRGIAECGGVIGLNMEPSFLENGTKEQRSEGGLEQMIRHVRHIIRIGGSECLGLGTDFDGIWGNDALPDCSYMPRLAEALEQAGFSNSVIEGIFHRNVMRLLHESLA